MLERLADLVRLLVVARRLARFDVVAEPVALPGPVLREPRLAQVGAVVVAALKGERIRLAVIGASPGEHDAASRDEADLLVLSLRREAAELAAVVARGVMQALRVSGGEVMELLELVIREIRNGADKLRIQSVELSVQRLTGALTMIVELAAGSTNLFVTATLVILDQLGIVLGLLRQVAIGRLRTDPNGLMKELAAEMETNGAERFLVVTLVVLHLLLVIQRVRKDLHRVFKELASVNLALESGRGATRTMRCDGSGDGVCIFESIEDQSVDLVLSKMALRRLSLHELFAALLHARAPLEILMLVLLGLLGLFLLFALLLEGEFVQPALILVEQGPVLLVGGGSGMGGGHAWNALVVLRFYFFSLPISVAGFSFNFFRCDGH